jgi:glycosyltransferase involved in cell wall biosynthesis
VDIIHARSRAPAWSALLAARLCGIRFVTTYHGAYSQQNRIKGWYNSVMARGDAVIANSGWTKALILERRPKAAGKVHVVPRGTDFARFDAAAVSAQRKLALLEQWGLEENDRIILHLARLTNWKGQHVLLSAFSRISDQFPDVQLVFAGDAQGRDSYRESLERDIEAHDLVNRVHIVGHCDDPSAAMALADVAAVPSIEPEAFGRAAVEAQALGTPVVVSNLGAVSETVKASPPFPPDERTGWIVPPGDAPAFAEALREALLLSDQQRDAISQRARRHVEDNFSLAQMCRRTLSIYEELVVSRQLQPK